MNQPTDPPTITRKEVSWHATVAAIRARKQAESLGMDPAALAALAHCAAADSDASDLPMITLGTLWAMGETERFIGDICGVSDQLDQILVCHTLLHPEDVLLAALEGDLESIRCGMVATSNEVTALKAAQISNWFNAEMQRVKSITGGQSEDLPKK